MRRTSLARTPLYYAEAVVGRVIYAFQTPGVWRHRFCLLSPISTIFHPSLPMHYLEETLKPRQSDGRAQLVLHLSSFLSSLLFYTHPCSELTLNRSCATLTRPLIQTNDPYSTNLKNLLNDLWHATLAFLLSYKWCWCMFFKINVLISLTLSVQFLVLPSTNSANSPNKTKVSSYYLFKFLGRACDYCRCVTIKFNAGLFQIMVNGIVA